MELPPDFFQVIQDIVLKPDIGSAFLVFWFSFLNELLAIFPYVAVISGQILFLDSDLTIPVLSKLLLLIALPAGVGGALGSFLTYGITYIGGKPMIEKFGKYIRVSWNDVEKVTKRFQGAWYDEIVFLLLRSIPVLPPLPINVAAGVLRMPPLKYFILTFVAFTIRMMVMFIFMALGAEVLSY